VNTHRTSEPTVEQLLATAHAHGIAPSRLRHLDDAGLGDADVYAADLDALDLDTADPDGSTSTGALLADYRDLTDMKLRTSLEAEHGLYIAESTKIIDRALRAGHEPRSLLMSRAWFLRLAPVLAGDLASDAPILLGTERQVDRLAGFHVHRGALASMRRPRPREVSATIAGARRVVIVEDVVDHTNLGAIFRSAAGLGVDAVLLSPSCADPLYRRSIRVSMGTVFQVPWARFTAWPTGLQELRREGFTLAALALEDDSVTLREFAATAPERVALLLGTEGDGLRPATLAQADASVLIPMAHAVDSLNVAAATAVACYALQIE
jgi:tRNA G18 (ribose-2'-O)-methylase SpoU